MERIMNRKKEDEGKKKNDNADDGKEEKMMNMTIQPFVGLNGASVMVTE